ncbi:MAG: hypothetical protein KC501_40585 [Myxococcales bacterium]|nr:hypothetical protein [Myxococcales bacterium]
MLPEGHPRRFDRPRAVAWAVLLSYLVAARLVGNLFPLSTFDMYQGHAPPVATRVLVLDATGTAAQVDDYEGYACEGPPLSMTLIEQRCGEHDRPLDYVLRDQALHIEAHAGEPTEPGTEPITLVARAHRLQPGPDQGRHADCVVARCTARRRGGRR